MSKPLQRIFKEQRSMIFSKRKGVSPLIAAVLLIAFTMAIAAILTAWIAGFTQDHKEKSEAFDRQISCAYSNIELDRDYARWDPTNQIFYGFVSNTGVDAITLTKVETWVDNEKQLPIKLNISEPSLTSIEKNDYLEIYVNLSNAFSSGGSDLTKITFITECDPVFDSITQPQGGWNSFTWPVPDKTLANDNSQ
ncbi:MAG: type IV pilin [Candidatus Aenigmarchaeota archaeon]|nr:type IV pilin [Candidatus Aenigmarchaeota archaeon]